VSEEVVDLAMGRWRRGSHQLELVDNPPERVLLVPRGVQTPLVLLYTWLPVAVLPLFELPEPFLHLDLSNPVPDWPRAITKVHLELVFKCVGEQKGKAQTGPDHDQAGCTRGSRPGAGAAEAPGTRRPPAASGLSIRMIYNGFLFNINQLATT